MVAEMRGRGLSAQQIANVLNGRKVLRPNGTPWTGKGVQSIIQSLARTAPRDTSRTKNPTEGQEGVG
nr:recombinase family protein [uncultured Lichenicoccus sp.]